MLVGQVMEMVMTLIGKRLPAQRLEPREIYPSKDEASGRYSTSSSSTKFTMAKKGQWAQSSASELFFDVFGVCCGKALW